MKKKAKQPNNLVPLILIAVGVILVISVIIWQISTTSSTAINNGTGSNNALSAATPEVDKIDRVTPQEAKAAIDANQAVIVDVRSADSYASEHIKGAVNIPYAEIETQLGKLDPGDWIITYCT